MTTATGLGWPVRVAPPVPGMLTGLGWPGSRIPDVPRGTSSEPAPAVVPEPGAEPEPAVAPEPRHRSEQTVDETRVDSPPAPEPALSAPVPPRPKSGARGPFDRPVRTRIVAVANQKGGVGKTTSVVNLAAALAQNGLRVLVIDLDPQGNASTALGIDHRPGTPSIYDVLIGGDPMAQVVRPCAEFPLLQVIAATIDLAGAEIELVSMVARESRLARALTRHLRGLAEAERPHFVLIDCPPSLGLITLNALVAARELLVPIQCEYYALEGLGQLVQTVDMVTQHLNEDLEITAILLTMFDARTRLAGQVAEEVRTHFGDRVLRTVVPRSVRISEAPSYQQTVLTFDPTSSGALSYVQAARELAASRHAPDALGLDAGEPVSA